MLHYECCSFRKLFLLLHYRVNRLGRHIESVFRTPYLKMWKFSELRDNEQHSFLVYIGVAHSVPTALYYTGVGHCNRVF